MNRRSLLAIAVVFLSLGVVRCSEDSDSETAPIASVPDSFSSIKTVACSSRYLVWVETGGSGSSSDGAPEPIIDRILVRANKDGSDPTEIFRYGIAPSYYGLAVNDTEAFVQTGTAIVGVAYDGKTRSFGSSTGRRLWANNDYVMYSDGHDMRAVNLADGSSTLLTGLRSPEDEHDWVLDKDGAVGFGGGGLVRVSFKDGSVRTIYQSEPAGRFFPDAGVFATASHFYWSQFVDSGQHRVMRLSRDEQSPAEVFLETESNGIAPMLAGVSGNTIFGLQGGSRPGEGCMSDSGSYGQVRTFNLESHRQRTLVNSYDFDPVSWCVDGNQLYWSSGKEIRAVQLF